MKRLFKNILAACLAGLVCSAAPVRAEKLLVAVAADFTAPMKLIVSLFTAGSGIEVLPSYGGTGMLYAIIHNGAPFDLFLAADQRRPELLYKGRLAEKPRIYARGQAVLWTAKKNVGNVSRWQDVLNLPGMNRVAVANPELAPYGAVVMGILSPSLRERLAPRLVYAQNVVQAFQYAQKAADCGFTALSLALSKPGLKGRFWPISKAPFVKQSACIIKSSRHRQAAGRFFAFLFSQESRVVLKKFGYQ
ncbi:molybdate ABC transporter substrate-binding protein [Desulfobacterota bacterium M19]